MDQQDASREHLHAAYACAHAASYRPPDRSDDEEPSVRTGTSIALVVLLLAIVVAAALQLLQAR